MFPLALAVLNGIAVPHRIYSLYRAVSTRGNVPNLNPKPHKPCVSLANPQPLTWSVPVFRVCASVLCLSHNDDCFHYYYYYVDIYIFFYWVSGAILGFESLGSGSWSREFSSVHGFTMLVRVPYGGGGGVLIIRGSYDKGSLTIVHPHL